MPTGSGTLRRFTPIAGNRFRLGYQPKAAQAGKEELIEMNRARGSHALAVMENNLAQGHTWFSGPSYGIAGVALYAYTHVAEEGEFSLAPFPCGHGCNGWQHGPATSPCLKKRVPSRCACWKRRHTNPRMM